MRPVAAWNLDDVGFDLLQQPQRFEFGNDLVACDEPVQPAVALRHFVVQRRVVGKHVVHRQPVTLPDVVVVEVMGRRDFHAAGAEGRIDIVVGDDRDPPPDDRQDNLLADKVPVAFVVRMHGHSAVAQHRLGSSGCHDEMAVTGSQRVAEVPQVAVFIGG